MLPLLLLLFLGALGAQGGSPCPPRSEIYPCACANLQGRGRRAATLVTCIGLRDSSSLEQIFNGALRTLEVDQIHILDSFWEEPGGGSLPSEFLALAKVSEIQIVDTRLSPCFSCSGKTNCRNNLTTRISVSNSSSSERVCSLCEASKSIQPQPWTGCVGDSLKEFRFSGGQLTTVGVDLFPIRMAALDTLDLSNHRIAKVEPRALRNLPALKSLDLSGNVIELIDHVFAGQTMPLLQHLDLSYNLIIVLGTNFLPSFPSLKRLIISHNALRDMNEEVWRKMPESLKNVDLRGNPLHCDCSVRWVNASLPVGYEMRGDCASPPDYARSPLRQASRLLTTRCSPGGVLGTRPPSLRKNRKKATKRP